VDLAPHCDARQAAAAALMRVFMNFSEVRGPYGGANSFLRALSHAFRERGMKITSDPAAAFDVALLNALTAGLDRNTVERLADRGKPLVHRKVGYRASGSPDMRSVSDGIVYGDRVQVEFTPYLTHTVFQSAYSRDVFLQSGFDGPYTVIHNGADERVFNRSVRSWRFGRTRERAYWDGAQPLRVVVSTWSTDENKGFEDYRTIDRSFVGRRDVELSLVGRIPSGERFESFRIRPPRRRQALAALLKQQHVVLQLARHETCSNALIEGINCGLPAVYLDSGANLEVASRYGTPYEGDLDAALARIHESYSEIVGRIAVNPYRISLVTAKYLDVLQRACEGET
jgi:hypothetical protein